MEQGENDSDFEASDILNFVGIGFIHLYTYITHLNLF